MQTECSERATGTQGRPRPREWQKGSRMNYAILGSGAIGTALARRFVAKSINITVANTKGPQSLAGLASELGPIVRPVTASEALQADVVILAIPFDAVRDAVKGVEW